MFVPTFPMVSMPFDINLEENAHGIFLLLKYLMLQRLTRLADCHWLFSSRKSKQKGKVQKCKANKHSTHQHDRIQSISGNSDEHSSQISEHIYYSTGQVTEHISKQWWTLFTHFRAYLLLNWSSKGMLRFNTNLLHHNIGHRSVHYATKTYCIEEVQQGFHC